MKLDWRWLLLLLIPLLLIGAWMVLGGSGDGDTETGPEPLSDEDILADVEDHWDIRSFLDDHPNADTEILREAPTAAASPCPGTSIDKDATYKRVVFNDADDSISALYNLDEQDVACVNDGTEKQCEQGWLDIRTASVNEDGSVAVLVLNDGRISFDALELTFITDETERQKHIPGIGTGSHYRACWDVPSALEGQTLERIEVASTTCPSVTAALSDIEVGTLPCE